jgi:hypothetical protein
MSKSVLSWVVALLGIIFVVVSVDPARAERKVALVVGNTQYKNPSLVLLNPKNDAEDVAAVLRSLDFEVILTVDATKRDFDVAMTQFARAATGADAALFYYAGHALQYQGRNYLMPTDGELEDEVSLRYQMVLLDDVRAAVERADGVKIVILDACRNNPVVDNLRKKMAGVSRSIDATRGLARIDKALGMVVAYSTAADDVAADGAGRNSPFTSALLRRLKEPGLEIGSMFRRIAADVNEKTNGRQRPETYVSLIGEYYLNQKDRPVWDQIKDSSDPAAFRSFISQFPSSPRASDAQYRLQMIERLAKQSPPNPIEADAGRTKVAAVEPERIERPAVPPRQAEDDKVKLTTAERQRPEPARPQGPPPKLAADTQKQASLTVAPPPEPTPPRPVVAPLSQDQACKRDDERLARLRASQVREDIIRFETELSCERLRPQVLRLKESIVVADNAGAGRQIVAPPALPLPQPPQPPLAQQATRADAGQDSALAQSQLPALSSDEACKRDEERLTRLRSNPVLDQVVRFEQELRCTRLRPQIVRLRESVSAN